MIFFNIPNVGLSLHGTITWHKRVSIQFNWALFKMVPYHNNSCLTALYVHWSHLDHNTNALVKKAQEWLHFLCVLRQNNLNQNLLLAFYHSSVESMPSYCLDVWYAGGHYWETCLTCCPLVRASVESGPTPPDSQTASSPGLFRLLTKTIPPHLTNLNHCPSNSHHSGHSHKDSILRPIPLNYFQALCSPMCAFLLYLYIFL